MTEWGPQGREVYERTYARDKADGSKEQWADTVARVVDGNMALAPEWSHEDGERDALFNLIHDFKAIPAGRHLWTSGVPGRQFNRNCHRAGFGPRLSDHFTFTFDELMKGGGVGANYSSEYLDALPTVEGTVVPMFYINTKHEDYHEVTSTERLSITHSTRHVDKKKRHSDVWTVEDSREGWVEALGFLVAAVTDPGFGMVIFDLSEVRPRGSKINGFGGTASGPGPLAEALHDVAAILAEAVGRKITPLEAMRIDHAIARCVIAGNVRRSARMSILHWNDPYIFDFIDCKADHADHFTTNISVEVDSAFFIALELEVPHAVAVFERVTEAMLRNGEPGFFNSDLASIGEYGDVRSTNPCGEIALEPWESCNLGHVNLSAFGTDWAGARDAFRLMSRFLYRATFADLTDERQAEVEARNRRIGVGFFGFQEWLGELGIPYSKAASNLLVKQLLEDFKEAAVTGATRLAYTLDSPIPVKFTTVAPTGTIAKMPGTTEGMHPVYSRYYERRVRYASSDPKVLDLEKEHEVEDCIYSPNTKVVVFHTRDAILDRVPETLVEQADELSVDEMLAAQRLVQTHYADNAVSFTVNVDPETSVDELRNALRRHLPHLKGTTVMPDASRPQSPYTRISAEEYEAATDHEVGVSYDECATGACPVR